MLNDKIIFWWDENTNLFIPTGGKIRNSTDGGVLGYGAREISGWLSNDI